MFYRQVQGFFQTNQYLTFYTEAICACLISVLEVQVITKTLKYDK